MAFGSWVQGNTANPGAGVTSGTVAFSSNVTAGNTLMLTIRQGTASNTITVSDSLNGSWSQNDGLVTGIASLGTHSVWRFPNTLGGACTITVHYTTAASMRMICDEYTGIFTLDSKAITSGSSTSPNSGNVTTTHTCAVYGSLVVGANNAGPGNNQSTAGSGFTQREQVNIGAAPSNTFVATEDMSTTQAAGTLSSSFTLQVSDSWGCFVGAYYQAATFLAPPALVVDQAVRRAGYY